MIGKNINLPEPAQDYRTGILGQGLGGGGDHSVLIGVAAGNDVIRVRRGVIARPRDHRYAAMADVALQVGIRLEDAGAVQLLRKVGPLLIVKMQREPTADSVGGRPFASLDGRLGRAEQRIGPNSQVDAICGDGESSRRGPGRLARETYQPRQ